jgi:hypothetical protein
LVVSATDNKLVDKITFRIVGKNGDGDETKKELVVQKDEKNACLFYQKAFMYSKLFSSL